MGERYMRVGIIGAMDIEVDHLKQQLVGAQVEERAGMEFWSGMLWDVPVVIVMCGEGKVNAALCAACLIERFAVTHVVNTGVAGSLDPRINIGDIVVSTKAVQHDMDVTALGHPLGKVPCMDVLEFPCDDDLRSAAVRAAHDVAPQVHVYEGIVASADRFVSGDADKKHVADTFGALCCEMEGAAIAQVCYLYDVPLVIVRALSDKADGSAKMDYPTFKHMAARFCAGITEGLMRHLGDIRKTASAVPARPSERKANEE